MGEEKQIIRGRMELAGLVGPLWVIGWLFTIGFCQLSGAGRLLFALVLWPYYLGAALR